MPVDHTLRTLAKTIRKDLKETGKITYAVPSEDKLLELFEGLYFASMNTEEGEMIKVRIAFYNPNDYGSRRGKLERYMFVPFERPLPYDVRTIVKLSKSADPWSSSLAVYNDEEDNLKIYGLIDQAIHAERFLNRETNTRPDQAGLFQVSISGIGSLSVMRSYDLIATYKQNKLVTNFVDVLRGGPISKLLRSKAEKFQFLIDQFVADNEFTSDSNEYARVLLNTWRDTISRLLIQIKNYRHGGSILITGVQLGLDIKYPLKYDRMSRSMLRLAKYVIAGKHMSEELEGLKDGKAKSELLGEYIYHLEQSKSVQNELKGTIRFIAAHSCVDGLILLDEELNELGYGVVINQVNPPEIIYQAVDNTGTESTLEEMHSSDFGTRHRSMISYCFGNEGSLGFVVSQDGDIRAFMRVGEKLIMWENIKTHKYIKQVRFSSGAARLRLKGL